MQAMKINGGKDVGRAVGGDVELSEDLHLLAGSALIEMKLFCDGYKILLQDLGRDNSSACAAMLFKQMKGPLLFSGAFVVIGIHEDIRINEATNAHEFHRD